MGFRDNIYNSDNISDIDYTVTVYIAFQRFVALCEQIRATQQHHCQ